MKNLSRKHANQPAEAEKMSKKISTILLICISMTACTPSSSPQSSRTTVRPTFVSPTPEPQIALNLSPTLRPATAAPEPTSTEPPRATDTVEPAKQPPPAKVANVTPNPGNTAILPSPTLVLPSPAELSPDASQIGENELALLYTQNNILYRLDLSSSAPPRPLAYVSGGARLSPDGRYLAYADEIGLYAFDLQQGEHILLAEHYAPGTADVERYMPHVWSPQNVLLVRRGFMEGGTIDRWIAMDERKLNTLTKTFICSSQSVWSPDGTLVAMNERAPEMCGQTGLLIVDIAGQKTERIVAHKIASPFGSNQKVLANVYDMQWSPTGAWLAFGLEEVRHPMKPTLIRLYLVRPDGRDLTPLTDNSDGYAWYPIWESEKKLYFVLDERGPQVDGIYSYDLTTQTQTKLVAGSVLQLISLSPDGEFLLYQHYERFHGDATSDGVWLWSVSDQQAVSLPTEPDHSIFFVNWLAGDKRRPPQYQVQALLAAPGEPGRLYALLSGGQTADLAISDDFGETWSPFPGGLPVEASCFNNVNLDYAQTDALYASTCQGLYRWQQGRWALISPQLTRMVAIVYGQPEAVWAVAEDCRQALRSDDGGKNWGAATVGLDLDTQVNTCLETVAIDPRNPNVVYSAARQPGGGASMSLYRGTATGQWTPILATKELAGSAGTVSAGLTLDGQGTMYIVVDQSLWRSQNPDALDPDDIPWEAIHYFDSAQAVHLLASGWGPTGLALYATIDGTLHRSLDQGVTWERLPIALRSN